jgi:DNA repair photolyase
MFVAAKAGLPMTIISASRRTDIPAFYAEWFMNRVRAGFVRWPNAYGGPPYEVSLRPEDVSAVVFWSKNYMPLMPYLDELDALGWGMCFHFTITGLPSVFEPNVPPADEMLKCARTLATRYGPEAVLWRYDPIVMSSITDADYHIRRFEELASALEGATRRCYFSFTRFYGKVIRNTAELKLRQGIECLDVPRDRALEIALRLADIAAEYGIEMYSCCGEHLVGGIIKKAHCVDGPLLHRLFPDRVGAVAERPSREGCGCYESKDIGAYHTCPHGCVYCYANSNRAAAARMHRHHKPETDMITGSSGLGDFRSRPKPAETEDAQVELRFSG